MNRYTISDYAHHEHKDLFMVLDKNIRTNAYAKKEVIFSDECEVQGGFFYNGEYCGGFFFGGTFHGGTYLGGTFFGGEYYGGVFRRGFFYGGKFHGGFFHNGMFYGGTFYEGEYYNGVFRSGTFQDMGFRNFYSGTYEEGWLPLQIQGSKHFVNIPDGKHIQIGSIRMTPNEWLDAGWQRYTKEQVKEYKRYIEIAKELIEGS